MAIILRFVDRDGFIRERFFQVVGVDETSAPTLKNAISKVLTTYNLEVENMRGQGYDGASNMRGAWKGLQALFLKDCSYAYYIHYFAHRLQLALVATSKDVHDVWLFFSKLSYIVNLLSASLKRRLELKSTREFEVAEMIASGELKTGKGANQICVLQRAGATRWSSHFNSVARLIEMFDATSCVLENMVENGLNNNIRGEAKGAYKGMKSFEFVFILLMMNKVMGYTDMLCQALQVKNQDILNAMRFVSTTKSLLQKFRKDGWDTFIQSVTSFCDKHHIDIPDLSAQYKGGTRRSCQQHDCITVEHYYHFDIFNAVIDFQRVELDDRFPKRTMELLILSSSLDPSDSFKSFHIDNICNLAEKFYPQDFCGSEIGTLRRQLEHYELDVPNDSEFQNISSLSELCHRLFETKRPEHFHLIDRLIHLVLTLPVSTVTTERAFSAMKLIKTALRSKMEDEFLASCMVIYIEREFSDTIDPDMIIDEFCDMGPRRVSLKRNSDALVL